MIAIARRRRGRWSWRFSCHRRVYARHWRFLYGGTIGVMLFVFVFAEAVRGSKRWIDLGPFQFQPSEFGKLFFVLAIAGFLVERGRRVGEITTVAGARSGSGSCRSALVFLQPDLGTALVYSAALTAVLFLWRPLGAPRHPRRHNDPAC